MCGRTRCTLNVTQVARACGLRDGDADSVRTVEMDRFRPSYNVSPGAYVPVFRTGNNGHGPEVGVSCHAVHCMKWGLVPSFTKKTEKPDHYRMFNARSESIKEKASFRRLIPNNRCLVAVEGFYEWKKDGSKKQPYYIHFRDERPLVFAALYDCWENSEGEMLYTFTILTTRCAPALEWLHDRMPVIVGNNDNIQMWLSKSPVNLEAILAPYSDPDLVWYPVTSAMGKPSFEGPECIKEIPLKPAVQNQISNMFSKKADGISKCKPEPDTLKEDKPAMEEAAGESPEEKHQFDDISSAETKIVAREFHSLKRGFMGTGTDTEIKPDKPNNHSTAMSKKKLQTGDKQD